MEGEFVLAFQGLYQFTLLFLLDFGCLELLDERIHCLLVNVLCALQDVNSVMQVDCSLVECFEDVAFVLEDVWVVAGVGCFTDRGCFCDFGCRS